MRLLQVSMRILKIVKVITKLKFIENIRFYYLIRIKGLEFCSKKLNNSKKHALLRKNLYKIYLINLLIISLKIRHLTSKIPNWLNKMFS
jgi:hypothetical protein